MIRVRRVYEGPDDHDGQRFLVERLWPRGIRKEELGLTAWLRDVAPSTGLRQWFGHVPERWPEFQQRYRDELAANPESWKPLLEASRQGNVTLLYSAREAEHNCAMVLQAFLEAQL